MRISDLKPVKGSKHRKKILGRGPGSSRGRSCTKGMRGQNARSGRGTPPGFEGGQMPLARRIPKRGFTNIFRKEYAIVNLGTLDAKFEPNSEVTNKALKAKGLLKKDMPLKVLGAGTLSKPLKIIASGFSKTALDKIQSAGGEAIKI